MRPATQHQTNSEAFGCLETFVVWCSALIESSKKLENKYLDSPGRRLSTDVSLAQQRIRCYCRLTLAFDDRYGCICGSWTCDNSIVVRILFLSYALGILLTTGTVPSFSKYKCIGRTMVFLSLVNSAKRQCCSPRLQSVFSLFTERNLGSTEASNFPTVNYSTEEHSIFTVDKSI